MVRNTFWIKLHVGYLTDADFIRLPDDTKWHFLGMYLIAKNCNGNGRIETNKRLADSDDIALLLHSELAKINRSISILLEKNFLYKIEYGYGIVDFEENQTNTGSSKTDDDIRTKNKIRQQKHRNKEETKEESEKELKEEIESEEEEEGHNVTEKVSQRDNVTEPEVSRGIPEIDLKLPSVMVTEGHYWCRGNLIEIIKEDRIPQVYYTDNGEQTSWPWREFTAIARKWDVVPKCMGVRPL